MHMRLSFRASIFAAVIALAALGMIAGSDNIAAADAGTIPNNEGSLAVSQAITSAVNSPDRPAADKQLDPGRHPEQILAFFGIAPGMHVADLWAGGGYTTELLARTGGAERQGLFAKRLLPAGVPKKTRRHGRRGSRSLE